MFFLRFNVTLALELLKDQLQGDKFGPLINLITAYLLQNLDGSALLWKVFGKKPNQFLVVVIPAQDLPELQRIDEHFGEGRALWTDASSDKGTFSLLNFSKPDSAFTFTCLKTLKIPSKNRDYIARLINGLFEIVMAKDRTHLPILLYRLTLATATATATLAQKSGVVVSSQEAINTAIDNLSGPDIGIAKTIQDTLAGFSLDILIERCREILVALRSYPFSDKTEGIELMKDYDPEGLSTTK